ncbi:MAG: Hpt domain-containing protein [Bdellovibrionales bacterium]
MMEDEVFIPKEARLQYLERRKKDLVTLRENLNEKKDDEFKRIGHQLKGNASTFGFLDLEKIAINLEKVGESKNWAEAETQLKLFENWISVESGKASQYK